MASAADPSSAAFPTKRPLSADAPTEVLKPGALYRECSIVTLPIAPLPRLTRENSGEKTTNRRENPKKTDAKLVEIELEDDDDYGGEHVGREVWEWYEAKLKTWEKQTASVVKSDNQS